LFIVIRHIYRIWHDIPIPGHNAYWFNCAHYSVSVTSDICHSILLGTFEVLYPLTYLPRALS
jgi:hypothetical protein